MAAVYVCSVNVHLGYVILSPRGNSVQLATEHTYSYHNYIDHVHIQYYTNKYIHYLLWQD